MLPYSRMKNIYSIAQQMIKEGKGILAADESTRTANNRLEAIGVESTEDNRRLFRDLFINTEGIEEYLNGIILYDETIRQNDLSGRLFTDILKDKGILIGIKVDQGKDPDPDSDQETVTKGIVGLGERLEEYKTIGAVFAKWRAVVRIGNSSPTVQNIEKEAEQLARYAKICQDHEMVPMIEPEVLLDGDHSIERAKEVTELTLDIVFESLKEHGVDLRGTILKTSMVLPGVESEKTTSENIAKETVDALRKTVPSEVAGIVFLSGGQSAQEATSNLNEICKINAPWPMTFSFSRALQNPSMDIWRGSADNLEKARHEFIYRLKMNQLALKGEYRGE